MGMGRRLATLLSATVVSLSLALGLAGPAIAVTTAEKLARLSSWTQTTATSYNAWNTARVNPDPWVAYSFNWSTDYCSSSPDNPLGFDFRLSCHRHDFGYRNYKAVAQFASSKPRLDNAFHQDLRRRCATYHSMVRPACYSLAWTYYQAVRIFGSLVVSQADLDRAEALLPAGPA